MRQIATIRLLTAAFLLIALPAWAGPPTESVKEYTDAVVKVLEDQSLKATDRRAAVRKLATEAFDVQETARRALQRGGYRLAIGAALSGLGIEYRFDSRQRTE